MSKPTLLIVIGSTRPGRVGLPVAEWFRERALAHGGFEVQVADLAEIDLPFMDEPNHPRLRQYQHAHTKAWSARVEAADAFVFVSPEYNHGYPAPLKNAIDYLVQEWQHKPVGLVTYGGVSGGTRAAQLLKPVLAALSMVPLVEAVTIPFVSQFLDEAGKVSPGEAMQTSAIAMLNALQRWETALKPLRA
jgi:NAD(P)H-dependent FMN reductase